MKLLKSIKAMFLIMFILVTSLFSFNTFAFAEPITEVEPNNNFDSAQKVESTSDVNGVLSDPSDLDFYQINLQSQAEFYAGVILGNEETETFSDNFRVVIYDHDGFEVANSQRVYFTDENTGEDTYLQELKISLEKGHYYIGIETKNEDIELYDQNYLMILGADYAPNFSLDSITTNVKSPQLLGKSITIQGNSKSTGLEYRFLIDGKVVRDFSSSTSYTWKPSKAGTFKVTVEARNPDISSSTASKQISYTIKDGSVKISSVSANLATPRPTNTSIRWTAKASGPDLQYKFSVFSNKKWSVIQNFTSKNYIDWKPKTAGAYQVRVDVKSTTSGKTAYKISSGYNIFKPSNFSITSISPSLKSPQFTGTYLSFKTKAKGSYLEYRYRISDGYGWYTVRDFSSTSSFNWNPNYTGTYKIAVDVRQRGTSAIKTATYSYTIKESPRYSMNGDYDIYNNSAYLKVWNKGYQNIAVKKIEFVNYGKVIFTLSPKNFITIGQETQEFYYYPKNPITNFSYDTVIKVYFQYDGLTHIAYLYRN